MTFTRCRTCCIPTTRPDTAFDATGQCSACTSYPQRPMIDWDQRRHELIALLDRHDGRVLVPSSAGKDSTYIALTLKELGADVTAVTATTCMLTEIGRKNIDNLAKHVPTIECTPNMTQRAKLNRLGLEMVGDISWPEHVAIFNVPFRVAVALNTPLLMYGECPQREYGGPPDTQDARVMTRRWVNELGGLLGLRPSDMEPMAGDMSYYMPPPAADLERVGVAAHFLGQYIGPWDSHHNWDVAQAAGMRASRPCKANWWTAENQDNAMTGIHDHFMWRKFGYGRGCAQISVDVRAGRIDRDVALAWVNEYDGAFPYSYMGVSWREVLDHIGMTPEQFYEVMDRFTNWQIFDRTHSRADGRPHFKCSLTV